MDESPQQLPHVKFDYCNPERWFMSSQLPGNKKDVNGGFRILSAEHPKLALETLAFHRISVFTTCRLISNH